MQQQFVPMLDSLLKDFRDAVLAFKKNPGPMATSVFILALAIGGNTAIFTVINSVLLKALPFPGSDRLMVLAGADTKRGLQESTFSLPRWDQLRADNRSFREVGVFCRENLNITGIGRPQQVKGLRITSGVLSALSVKPVLGRLFLPEEDQPGTSPVALISYELWKKSFGGDPAIAGKSIQLNSTLYTIVGVLPPGLGMIFNGVDLWVSNVREFSLFTKAQVEAGGGYLTAIGLLNEGVSLKAAQAEMDVLNRQYQEKNPKLLDSGAAMTMRLTALRERIVHDVRPTLLILWSSIILVLLIASANVANLTAALATTRIRDIAIRSALGASSSRIVRELFMEGLLLSLFSGALGSLLAPYVARLLLRKTWDSFSPFQDIPPDWRVWAFALAVSVATGLLVSVLPALQVRRLDINGILRDSGRGVSAGARGMRVREGLVVVQIALSIILLIGAGLMLKSIVKLRSVDPGFSPHNVLTMHLTLPDSVYPTAEAKRIFFNRLVAAVSSVPGVRSSAVGLSLPLLPGRPRAAVLPDGAVPVPLAQRPFVFWQASTPGYFHALGIRFLSGREFNEQDDENSPAVAIINETMAKRFWPDQDPLGKRIVVATELHPKIVGVIADVRTGALDSQVGPEIYTPYAQWPVGMGALVVRTATEPRSLTGSITAAIASVDKDQPVTDVRTMDEIVSDSLGNRRLMSSVLATFSILAVLLGVVGVYGTTRYWVSVRMHELGIRAILGARSADILQLVLNKGLLLIAIGVTLGLVFALALMRAMQSLVYQISTHDPVIFGFAALVFALVALAAIYAPARKVAIMDPILSFRKNA